MTTGKRVGLSDTYVILNIRHPVPTVLFDKTLRPIFVLCNGLIAPPLSESAIFVELSAGVVERMCELMAQDAADGAVVQRPGNVTRI